VPDAEESAKSVLKEYDKIREERDPRLGPDMSPDEYTWLKENPEANRFDYEAQRRMYR
jgi:hypothetical protein